MDTTNKGTANAWAANVKTTGCNPTKSLFFHHGILFSYGSHFPIASMKGETVFFTTQTHSVTTAKHKSLALSAARSHGLRIVFCHYVDLSYQPVTAHYKNVNRYETEIHGFRLKLAKARNKEAVQMQIDELESNLARYVAAYVAAYESMTQAKAA